MKPTPAQILTDLLQKIALRYGEMPTDNEEVDPTELRAILDNVLAQFDDSDQLLDSDPVASSSAVFIQGNVEDDR
ncbi:MAG: hypothetical protein JNJ77_03635 [Planctomycetia bacterium]|nr:hypothetical protein [Planctomycetia bacterium]